MYEQTSCFDCEDALKRERLGPAVSQRQTGLAFRLAVKQCWSRRKREGRSPV